MKRLVTLVLACVIVAGTVTEMSAFECGCGDLVTLTTCAVPANWYRMAEPSGTTLVDSGFSLWNGTYHGGFTLGATGIPGLLTNTAATFNGTTGYADIASLASLAPNVSTNNGWTVMAWFKPTSLANQMIVNMIDTATPYVWQLLAQNDHTIYFDLKQDMGGCGGGAYGAATGGNYTVGGWNMAVATTLGLNGNGLSRMRAYLNGAMVQESTSFSGTTCTALTSVNIARVNNGTFFFAGTIDEIEFYWQTDQTGLAEAQPGFINALYQAGISGSNCDWPFRADRPKLPKFKDDGYFNRLVNYGYNTGQFQIRARRPQFFDLGYVPIFPPGNFR